jgi:hypothetical protein
MAVVTPTGIDGDRLCPKRWSNAEPVKSCSRRWIGMEPRPVMISRSPGPLADAVRVPVIASGGVGTLDHLVEGIRDGHATAVLAASIFHFGTYTIGEAKQHMAAMPDLICVMHLIELFTGTNEPGDISAMTSFTLADLEQIVAARVDWRIPEQSWTARLAAAGMPKAAKKLGEEAVETVIAATSQGHRRADRRNRRPALSSLGRAKSGGCTSWRGDGRA